MTVNSDGDNSGMSLGYLINYALLPCSVAALPPNPGEGSYSFKSLERAELSLIMFSRHFLQPVCDW